MEVQHRGEVLISKSSLEAAGEGGMVAPTANERRLDVLGVRQGPRELGLAGWVLLTNHLAR